MTAAERIAEILDGMTATVCEIVEYDRQICAIRALIEADEFGTDDAQAAADAMFRMAAMARAAEAASRKFAAEMPEADAQSLDAVTRLKRAGMLISPKASNSIEDAREFLAADARRVRML